MVLQELPEFPAWPQLFHRSPLEHMGPQFTDGISDVTIEGDTVTLAGSPGEHDMPELREERAAGFFAFLKSDLTGATGLKGQVTGPLTFAHLVQMSDGGSADENIRITRRLAHLLGRLAEWQGKHPRPPAIPAIRLFCGRSRCWPRAWRTEGWDLQSAWTS